MKKVIFLGLILSILSCRAQQKPSSFSNKEPIKMEALDNKSFDEIQVNGEAKFTLPNGNSVRQIRIGDTYDEEISIKGTPFIIKNTYAKSNIAIQSSLKLFYGFPIGVKKFYDGNGNVIKEIDCDKPAFKFSIDDLALKIKNEFNIDIMKDNKYVYVSRTLLISDSVPLTYTVAFSVNPNIDSNIDPQYGDKRVLVIDGNTGSIISNTIKSYTK